jgi:hypothetical protein
LGGTWAGTKIERLTSDSMILGINDSMQLTYRRAKYPAEQKEHFDEIIISSSGCYGSCPVNSVSIKKDGQILYYGYRHNTKEGFYKAQVNSNVFSELEADFHKVALDSLKENYAADWSDDEMITVSLIKNGKIIKTISDYGRQSPREFQWAYTSARYLYQRIDLTSLADSLHLPLYGYHIIEKDGNICEVTQSEFFYLWSLLTESKISSEKFKPEYLFKCASFEEIQLIRTDGRLFKFSVLDGSEKTYDLGFDFIERNGLLKRLRPKNAYGY